MFINNILYPGITIYKKRCKDKFFIRHKLQDGSSRLYYYKDNKWKYINCGDEYLKSLPFYRFGTINRKCFANRKELFFSFISTHLCIPGTDLH